MNTLRIASALLLLTPVATADSLFRQTASKSDGQLIAQQTERFEIGDIITVLVRERVEASTSANTNTKKESEVDAESAAGENSFLVTPKSEGGLGILDPAKLPNWAFDTENEHRSQGQTTRASTLTTTITCRVTEVLPGGVIRIAGSKRVTVNREDSLFAVSGLARSKDVLPDNTLPSTLITDAVVELQGKGPLWNNQRRGLITRFLDWFAPY